MTNSLDDNLIDRIVDGVLGPAELRAAVDRLDREPDDWKRCAVAFLEAQCWSREMRQLGDATSRSPAPPRAASPLVAGGSSAIRHRLERAIAAGIAAAAFGLGWLAHPPAAAPGRETMPTRIAEAVIAPAPAEAESTLAGAAVPQSNAAAEAPWTGADDVGGRQPIAMVAHLRLGAPGAETDVPILSGPGIDAEWLNNQPPPVSEYGQAELQRHGYKVDQLRELVPATLSDGRHVAVPVDYVQIRYTGTNPL